jgi:L-asparaginase/Glu-tRNA(Gln) amidotransferase subunit D
MPRATSSKTSTYRLQTFGSLDFGALGHVDGDGVHFYRATLRAHMPDTPFAALDLGEMPLVDIVYSYAGADGALVDAAVAAGARGVVSASRPEAPLRSSARHSNGRPHLGSSSCNAAVPRAAASHRAAVCARAELSPARI